MLHAPSLCAASIALDEGFAKNCQNGNNIIDNSDSKESGRVDLLSVPACMGLATIWGLHEVSIPQIPPKIRCYVYIRGRNLSVFYWRMVQNLSLVVDSHSDGPATLQNLGRKGVEVEF